MTWEQVDSTSWRAEVPGGWVLKVYGDFDPWDDHAVENPHFAICFIPDPAHRWELEDDK